MAQQLRPTYPRASYHVMNRGDRREATFTDDAPLVVSKQALNGRGFGAARERILRGSLTRGKAASG